MKWGLFFSSIVFLIFNTTNAFARPSVGAIRWDYWFKGSPYVPLITPQWDSRRPAFATRNSDGSINMVGNQQLVVDQEINDASSAGIDYFAFLSYIGYDNDGLTFEANQPLGYFLKSSQRSKMKFTLILDPRHFGLSLTNSSSKQNVAWQKTKSIIVNLVSKPEYFKNSGKPLIYILGADVFVNYWSTPQEAVNKLNELKSEIKTRVGNNPQMVAMVWTNYHWNLLKNIFPFDFDGATSYSNAPTFDNVDFNGKDWGTANVELAYADLQKGCVGRDLRFRNAFDSSTPLIPSITSGWDERPLKGTDPYYSRGMNNSWCAQATPDEIAFHLSETLDWEASRASSQNLNSVLIYAWNEYLEGGFIAPMANGGDARLKAISRVLNQTPPPPPTKVLNVQTTQYGTGGTITLTNNCSVAGDYPNTCKADLKIAGANQAIAMTVKSTGGVEQLAACFSSSGGNYSAPWINYDLTTEFKTYGVATCTMDSFKTGSKLSLLALSFKTQTVTPIPPPSTTGPQLQIQTNRYAGSSIITVVGNKCSDPGDYANTCTANLQVSAENGYKAIILTVESSANGKESLAACYSTSGGSYRAPWINYDLKTTFRTYRSGQCAASEIKTTNKVEQVDLFFK